MATFLYAPTDEELALRPEDGFVANDGSNRASHAQDANHSDILMHLGELDGSVASNAMYDEAADSYPPLVLASVAEGGSGGEGGEESGGGTLTHSWSATSIPSLDGTSPPGGAGGMHRSDPVHGGGSMGGGGSAPGSRTLRKQMSSPRAAREDHDGGISGSVPERSYGSARGSRLGSTSASAAAAAAAAVASCGPDGASSLTSTPLPGDGWTPPRLSDNSNSLDIEALRQSLRKGSCTSQGGSGGRPRVTGGVSSASQAADGGSVGRSSMQRMGSMKGGRSGGGAFMEVGAVLGSAQPQPQSALLHSGGNAAGSSVLMMGAAKAMNKLALLKMGSMRKASGAAAAAAAGGGGGGPSLLAFSPLPRELSSSSGGGGMLPLPAKPASPLTAAVTAAAMFGGPRESSFTTLRRKASADGPPDGSFSNPPSPSLLGGGRRLGGLPAVSSLQGMGGLPLNLRSEFNLSAYRPPEITASGRGVVRRAASFNERNSDDEADDAGHHHPRPEDGSQSGREPVSPGMMATSPRQPAGRGINPGRRSSVVLLQQMMHLMTQE